MQQTLIFPVLLLAGVLLPLEGAPGLAADRPLDLNPLTYVVEAERALFAGTFPVDTVAYGFLGAAIVAALGLVVGLRAMTAPADPPAPPAPPASCNALLLLLGVAPGQH